MGWYITCGILFLLAVLPLGIRIRYDAGGFLAKVMIGPVKITVFPRPKKEAKKAKKIPKKQDTIKKEEKLPKPPQPPKQDPPEKKKETGGSLKDFVPLVKVALDLLGDLRRKLRLDELYLRLVLASSDPCDLAVNYGKTWAAVGSLMPVLEKIFVIKKRDVEVECDFTASETKVIARLDITITLGRLLTLAVVYGIRAVKEFLTIQKNQKGGAAK